MTLTGHRVRSIYAISHSLPGRKVIGCTHREVSLTTPVANNFGNPYTTTGTVNPGVIWVGSYFQVGLEAIIPINRESGTHVGVIGQLHLYLDDIFPSTVGQPLFGGTSSPQRKLTF